MTNIQAINLLKGLEQSLDDYCELNDEGKTAFRMAITALEVFGNSEQLPSVQPEPDINDVTCDNCDYSEKFVGGLILCRRTKTSHRVSATSTCGKGKREVEDAEAKI